MGLEDMTIPRWREICDVTVRANVLVLLNVLTERSLKELVRSKGKEPPSGGGNIVKRCLEQLREAGVQFEESAESEELRRAITQLRNKYAHGEWDLVRERLETVRLRPAFRTVSALFRGIERGW